MADTKLKTTILKTLQKIPEIWADEQKDILNETKLFHLVDNFGENNNALYKKVISSLLSVPSLKKHFFIPIKNVYVFKTKDFKFFIEENKINNSYTQYENKIGLSDGDRFLNESHDIVLNFPYKDCVLEGGQSTEEGTDTYFEYSDKDKKHIKDKKYIEKTAKRKEIFFNEILAYDEIDRLFDEKALVNWKRFTKNGTSEVKKIDRDANGTIKENLIIKGNNLLALHSLRRQFTRKVKLIYIDPPYNTGGEANIFTYNNSFNHSTWLTFMKNRLEVAKEFLREDGFIAIAIDHYELFYLGCLADEVFGRENRLGIITVVNNPMGRNQAKYFSTTNDYMIVYSKKKEMANFKDVVLNDFFLKTFDKEDDKGKYKLKNFIRLGGGDNNLKINKKSFWYPLFVSPDLKNISIEENQNYIEVYPITKGKQDRTWKLSKKSTQIKIEQRELTAFLENDKIVIYEKYRIDKGQKVSTVWTDKKYNANHHGIRLLEKFLNSNEFSFPKSLYTVLDTLKITTNKNDIIMDFHAGSGTTGHAVLELNKEDGGNRKFILVEQLDEHIAVCQERMQKVIQKHIKEEKEKLSTLTKEGNKKSLRELEKENFITLELAKWNEQARKEINACKNLTELKNLFSILCSDYFLNYNVTIKEFQECIIKEDNFIKLSLPEQKRMFLKMLDLNHMYIPRSEMNDKKFGLNKKDIKLTTQFYKQ
ncbi:adenine-specific DNA-methyltransferase [Spirochaetota bacterium]|nr:adenine-specific DNA-methyltransferase [Spirochaetota bacterium]